VAGKSLAAFDATHAFGNFSGQGEAVTGEILLDPMDLELGVRGALAVPLAALTTGIDGRDRAMRQVLDGERHPEIRFAVDGVDASFASLSDRSDVALTIRGILAIRDAARPSTFSARARLRQGRIWLRGEGALRLGDFGIAPPRRLFFRVGNDIRVRFDLLLQRAPP
jgi:polyisoprenoid-binding protein YceI